MVMQYIPCGLRTMDETYLDLQADVNHQEKHGFRKWAVFKKDTSEFIGRAGRAGWARMDDTHEVEVGFKFLPQYWGNGFATEVLQALLSWGKTQIPCSLVGFAYPDNQASLHVLKKAGMIYARHDEYDGKEIVVYCAS